MKEITVNASIPFVIGKHRDTRKAIIAQNSSATADMVAGTLLTPNADGYLVPCVPAEEGTGEETGQAATYPVCALINDIDQNALKAGNVEAEVVFNTVFNKEFVENANPDLEIDETFVWESVKNGILIKEIL